MSEPTVCIECGKTYGASWGDTGCVCGKCKNKKNGVLQNKKCKRKKDKQWMEKVE